MAERIKTYVDGLDPRLEGGIPTGYTVLISGPTGSMKSSLTFSVLYHAAKLDGTKCMYFSLEQDKQNLLEHMARMGMDIKDTNKNLIVKTLRPLREESKKIRMGMGWLDFTLAQISNYKKINDFTLAAIDSLNALCALSHGETHRTELFEFFHGLKRLGLTTLMIAEASEESAEFTVYGIEKFLADGIIHLAMERDRRTVTRYLHVVKMRKTKHATDYFPMLVEPGKFKILSK